MVDPLTSRGYTQAPKERKLDKSFFKALSSPVLFARYARPKSYTMFEKNRLGCAGYKTKGLFTLYSFLSERQN